MKTIAIILLTITMLIIILPATAEQYPSAGVVIEINAQGYIVIEDFSGERWAADVYDTDEFMINMVIAMTMDDNATEWIFDDMIIDLRPVGYLFDR